MERPLTSGQILPGSFCPKKGLEWWHRKVNRHKIFCATKGDNWRLWHKSWERTSISNVEKRERQNSSRNCLPKRVMNNAFAGVTNCFYSFNMFVRNSSREKLKDLYYFTWVSLGSWRRKLEFSDIWPYLSTFGHLATSFKTFTVTFTFCPGAWKIHSLTQNAALLRQNFTALKLRGYLDINTWIMSIF